jgi:DNA modification methylase
MVEIYQGDCRNVLPEIDCEEFGLLFLDPPFNVYEEFSIEDFPKTKTIIAFTNPKNRFAVYEMLGKPRFELIWNMGVKDGRWNTHKGPLAIHEAILVYGETGEAYVGDYNTDRTPRKLKGSVGSGEWKATEDKWYVPRERKLLTSVLSYPQDKDNQIGRWGKPLAMVERLIEWVDPDSIIDPFMGSGTTLVAGRNLKIPTVGIELEQEYCELAKRRLSQMRLPI